MNRKETASLSVLEEEISFARATRIGNTIAVSGTAPIRPDGSTAFLGDLYGQTRFCLDIIADAIRELGGSKEGIIRTRLFLTDIRNWKEAARAHGEFFMSIRPACTFAEVSRFIDEAWLIEIEADCIVSET